MPTAFCKSHADGDPFFTLTQNALANLSYLEYLQAMYGGKLYIPTADDSQRCFQDYMADVQRRLQENKLKPGEDVKVSENGVQVSGQVAVMEINGLISKVVFDRNPDREFYIEESFPLDWMYPYLEPHGLIMKLDRQPLAQLPEDIIAQDHEYWRKLVAGMLGDWLNEQTRCARWRSSLTVFMCATTSRGFTGDPRFIQNDYAKKTFSKLRSSIAGVYAWRFRTITTIMPPNSRLKSRPEAWSLFKEADFAFRQALALCPYSPEALSDYVNWLLPSDGPSDAQLRIVHSAVQLLRRHFTIAWTKPGSSWRPS